MSTDIAVQVLQTKIAHTRNELGVQQHRLLEAQTQVAELERTISDCEAAIMALTRPRPVK